MEGQQVQITSAGIINSLKRYDAFSSIAEYVWNGFDAEASRIDISLQIGNLHAIEAITISDNGYGIARDNLDSKFKPFYQSGKTYDPKNKQSTTHGKNGVGRLTFFTFCSHVRWYTIFTTGGENFEYTIDVDSVTLETFNPSTAEATTKPTGTTVYLSGVDNRELSKDTIEIELAKQFCWFLELHKDDGYSITIDGKPLDYSASVKMCKSEKFLIEGSKISVDINIVCWNHKLDEYSKYYYIKSDGKELGKENTTFNNKGDNFYHSVYIKSAVFDNFDLSEDVLKGQQSISGFMSRSSAEYVYTMRQANAMLYAMRKPFLQDTVGKVIADFDIVSAFPAFDKNNPLDNFKKREIESMLGAIYMVEPKLFTSLNKEQKKTFVRLLDLTLQSGEIDALFQILQEIIVMSAEERTELSEIFKLSRMSDITKTVKMLQDRYQAANDLRVLVFNRDLGANEVHHIQKFIEKHYWLFGEQFSLVTAAEPNFEQALRRHLNYLHKEYEDVAIENKDKYKQMDIFAVRQDLTGGIIHNIVVELKHPDIPLGETQLSQVKKYMSVILSTPEFNASNMNWTFYLVGNRFNQNGYMEMEIENNKHHGESSLVFSVGNYKIYVKTWSEVLGEFELRHKFLNDKLRIERAKLETEFASADDIISKQSDNSAAALEEMDKI